MGVARWPKELGVMQETGSGNELREQAVASLKKKREFRNHLFVYVTINSMLVVIWAVTGARFFWPIFPLLGWGVGVIFHARDTFSPGLREEDIQREIARMR
jgi:2TM domain-containing protein